MRLPHTVWLKFSLQREVHYEVFTMARWCLSLHEGSGGWGQRQPALLCLSAQPGIEEGHCQHSHPISLQLGTNKQSILDKWSKPRCPNPYTEKIRQRALLETKRHSINFPPAHLSPTFCQNVWIIQSLPEGVAELLECLVEGHDLQGIGYQKLLKAITWNNYPKEKSFLSFHWVVEEKTLLTCMFYLLKLDEIKTHVILYVMLFTSWETMFYCTCTYLWSWATLL